jgi:hypothetical protein
LLRASDARFSACERALSDQAFAGYLAYLRVSALLVAMLYRRASA